MKAFILALLGVCGIAMFQIPAMASPDGSLAASGTSAAAAAELRAAIKILKSHHMNSGKLDWKVVDARAFAMASGAQKPADAYPAIRYIIAQLGVNHTQLVPAQEEKAMTSGHASDKDTSEWVAENTRPPEALSLVDKIGYLRIPFHMGSRQSDVAYVAALRDDLRKFQENGFCRFIVDLRDNGGGNMWPMLNGLASLLGDPPFGYFEIGGVEQPWDPRTGWMGMAYAGVKPVSATLRDAQGNMPVALLINSGTGSAGEFTAIAFEGRSRTSVFGEPTAGLVTTNAPYPLPDGASLLVSEGWTMDRRKRAYRVAVTPDEQTPQGQPTLDAALRWLKAQDCTGK